MKDFCAAKTSCSTTDPPGSILQKCHTSLVTHNMPYSRYPNSGARVQSLRQDLFPSSRGAKARHRRSSVGLDRQLRRRAFDTFLQSWLGARTYCAASMFSRTGTSAPVKLCTWVPCAESQTANALLDMARQQSKWKHAFHLGALYSESTEIAAAERSDTLRSF
jgi:hypothetical protein